MRERYELLHDRALHTSQADGPQFTLQGTNTYIVGTGDKRLIIDTGQGIPEWADLISSTLDRSEVSLSHVLLTHWHGDHTGGVPDLLRLYPHLEPAIYKHTPSRSQQPITDGQVFSVEGATVRAVHAPGHSHDHMCFVLEEENAMVSDEQASPLWLRGLSHSCLRVSEHPLTGPLTTSSRQIMSWATGPRLLSS